MSLCTVRSHNSDEDCLLLFLWLGEYQTITQSPRNGFSLPSLSSLCACAHISSNRRIVICAQEVLCVHLDDVLELKCALS